MSIKRLAHFSSDSFIPTATRICDVYKTSIIFLSLILSPFFFSFLSPFFVFLSSILHPFDRCSVSTLPTAAIKEKHVLVSTVRIDMDSLSYDRKKESEGSSLLMRWIFEIDHLDNKQWPTSACFPISHYYPVLPLGPPGAFGDGNEGEGCVAVERDDPKSPPKTR